MPHVLAKLKKIKAEEIKKILLADAPQHAEEGLFLEHIWQNADDIAEVLFLFRTDDLNRAKRFIDRVHTQALKENPDVNLPHMVYLEEK